MLSSTDYHIHTEYLKCADSTMTVEAIFRKAEELGLKSIGITDHLNKLDFLPEHLKIKQDIQNTPTNLEVFFGVELNLLSVNGDIPYDESIRDEMGFEFAIGGIHATYLETYDLDKLIEIQHRHHCRFASDPLIDVVVHPWWFSWGEFDKHKFPWFNDLSVVPEEYHIEFAKTAKENSTAIEINSCAIFCNSKYSDSFKEQYWEYVNLLKEQGVMLSICSDAHNINQLGTTRIVEEKFEQLGVPENQIWTPKLGKTWRARR
jgi:histidinol phosphatase-like PHP family hydrolase